MHTRKSVANGSAKAVLVVAVIAGWAGWAGWGCDPDDDAAPDKQPAPEREPDEAPAQAADDAPHIVYITSDDQSVPDLGIYGNDAVTSPNMDEIASEGILFERAYASSPQCSPARASLVTGQTPSATRSGRLHTPLDPMYDNIIETLSEAGYFMAAFRKVHLGEKVEAIFDFKESDEDVWFDAAFEAWDGESPMFLHIGFNEPHRPYEEGYWDPPHDPEDVIVPYYLPDTDEVRQDLAHYYDEIAEMDRQMGELMDLLEDEGIADDTFLLFIGDNGLPFPGAKGTLYEPGIHVPFFAHWPGEIPGGQVTDELVSFADLPATVLDAAGLEPFEGVRDYAFSERNWHDNVDLIRAVIGERYKLIRNYLWDRPYEPTLDIRDTPSWAEIARLHDEGELDDELEAFYFAERDQYELFDLEEDPEERNNLFDDDDYMDVREELKEAMTAWMRQAKDPLPPPYGELPPAAEEAIRAQGEDPRDLFRK